MKTRTTFVAVIAVMAALAAFAPAAGASPAASTQSPANRPFIEVHTANLAPVPQSPEVDGGSNASGKVAYIRILNTMIVLEYVNGMSPGLPHAQHTHGIAAGTCPDADRRNEEGFITTAAAAPDYGSVAVSLTTNGDATPASALAVDRFPVANTSGLELYGRVLHIGNGANDFPPAVAYNLGAYVTVTHGIDVNHNGAYDFDAGVSSLDPSLPLEATMPAACGAIG